MTAQSLLGRLPAGPIAIRLRRALPRIAALLLSATLAACGGSANAPPPPEGGPVLPVPPTITQQPADATVTAGQPASFSVAATGTAPLAYQWQRSNVDIVGATSTTYTLPATVLGDSGATFRAVVSNVAGSATSNTATLTVTAAAPVLTITQQPASLTVAAGTQASFTVGASCSSGTLAIRWQRSTAGGAFADIAGATAAMYAFAAATGDSASQFRAALDCSGQAATTSNAATLTVTAAASATLSLYPLNGLRDQARIVGTTVIDQLADGSTVFFVRSQLMRLSVDRSTITTIAGSQQTDGYADGPGATALFSQPFGLAHDATGVIYVADRNNHVIRRVALDGTVSTIAGSAGQSGSSDGSGVAARFREPSGIVLAPDGDLYVADNGNNTIRRVTTAGVVTTYAGSGTAGFADGVPATAQFNQPFGVAAAANGDLIVSDRANYRVRRIVRSGNAAGVVETLAGSGATTSPGADGIGAAAEIPYPSAVYVRGNIVFVRDNSVLIRQIDLTTRAVTTFTGSRALGEGFADGPPAAARFRNGGFGLTGGLAGGLLVGDDRGLRSVDAAGNVTTIAAGNSFETDAGTGVLAQLPFTAMAVTVDSSGRVANYDNVSRAVRRVDAAGNVSLVAGLTGSYGGVFDGTGSAAQFVDAGISIAAAASDVLYVGDTSVLRRIASDGTVTTIAGSTATFGGVDGQGAAARFNRLFGLAVGPGGDVFVADAGNNAIRRVDAMGNVSTYAGVMGQSGRVDGAIAVARLQLPYKVAFTPDGTLWFTDGVPGSEVLRRVSPDGTTVSTVAGAGSGMGISALAADVSGLLYYMVNSNIARTGGLYVYNPATDSSTLLLPSSINGITVLGNVNPLLPFVGSIAVLGPKRILVSGATQLLVVTLP
ncbi:MAG: hypothetical protein ABIQ06_09445 [Caldimonas sp.]